MFRSLDLDLAARFATSTLAHVGREFPYASGHVMGDESDWARPRELHPIFYGSYDWHSCVHGYWQLARLRRFLATQPAEAASVPTGPSGLPLADEIERLFDEMLTPAKVRGEMSYFQRPLSRGFERPYGWAWMLALADELGRQKEGIGASADLREGAEAWHEALTPLVDLIARRMGEFVTQAVYPIRAGTHANTAFALTLAHRYAHTWDGRLQIALVQAAWQWYLRDEDCQVWEPSLDDFLSPALVEAMCMRTILPREEFAQWLERFLPRLDEGEPRALFEPAVVTDRTDGKIVHLDGLNLSRAWCFRGIAAALDKSPQLQSRLLAAAERHLEASLPHVAGDYMGEHWLASFALLALEA